MLLSPKCRKPIYLEWLSDLPKVIQTSIGTEARWPGVSCSLRACVGALVPGYPLTEPPVWKDFRLILWRYHYHYQAITGVGNVPGNPRPTVTSSVRSHLAYVYWGQLLLSQSLILAPAEIRSNRDRGRM